MKVFRAELRSLTPYGQGKMHLEPKLPRELDDDYEQRVWLCKCHQAAGEVYIPPMAFKKVLENTAGYVQEKVPGRGPSTYTRHFRQGVICPEPVMLGIKPEMLRHHRQFVPAQPSKPKGGWVWRSFPVIDQWAGELYIHAIDDILTADIVQRYLDIGGRLVGIGVWRPQNGGLWGKFQVTAFEEIAA